ncbi:sulfotransferase domain-containing protein [Christiangramia sp. SM2212]|uniref:Sulfotransferase domain-containing protein n=1 Tax=Christiangramia sediminicola TaxID=3073267 RepID=A0ABU1EQA9_9FLAO|nr:sulfotransferase domain-containing protein [Christiangramia sp. SM2212]MDR5590577.1 sulfotransferase domain-containing protein [Christiangramia sp. SM2212]
MNKVAIFSVPRSGSSWLGQILNSNENVEFKFQPNYAYSFPLELTENDSSEDINLFFEELRNTQDSFVNGKITISSKKGIEFNKKDTSCLVFKETHYINVLPNLLKKSNIKILGLIRSPFAVINSWIKIPKEFNPEWDLKEEWENASIKNSNKKSHYFGYNKWKEAAFLFLDLQEKYPDRFKIINYNSFLSSKISLTKEIYNFCGLEMSDQTLKFIEDSSTKNDADDAYSIFKRKDKDDQWSSELPQFIINQIRKDEDFKTLNKIFRWIP